MRLKDIKNFHLQKVLNDLADQDYSYTVIYHVRDLVKAALGEAVENEVLARNTVLRPLSQKPSIR